MQWASLGSIGGLVGLIVGVGTVIHYIWDIYHSKKITIQADSALIIDKESLYLQKVDELRTEVDSLKIRNNELEQKVNLLEGKVTAKDREMLRIESLRVMALVRVGELEKENEGLHKENAYLKKELGMPLDGGIIMP